MQTLDQIQQVAREKGEALGFERKKGGLLARFPVRRFLSGAMQQSVTAESEIEKREGQIVFVDGTFMPALSHVPQPCVLLSMHEAYLTYGPLLSHRFKGALDGEKNPFIASGTSELSQGAFLYIPPREVLSEPLTVLHVITGLGPRHLNLQLFVGAEAKGQVVMRCEGGQSSWTNHVVNGSLEQGSQLDLLQMPSVNGWRSGGVRFDIKRDSNLALYNFCSGSQGSHYDARVNLLEESCSASFYGLSTLHDRLESHTRCEMRHMAPHCVSNQHIKSICRDQSVFSFDGSIYVDSKAQKTDAYQMNNNLLLSESAVAFSKPGLEIFADDVKASHGSTTGQLREDELFYLMTRGLSRTQAMELLVNAFAAEIIDRVAIEGVKSELGKAMLK